MKYAFEFMSLTQLGQLFEVSNQQVGKWLVALGLRTADHKPSRAAFAGGYVEKLPTGVTTYTWTWHAERTVERLTAAGHKVVAKPGSRLIDPPELCGPLTVEFDPDHGHKLVGADGLVVVWVAGGRNADLVCRLLNLADRHGKLRPQADEPPPSPDGDVPAAPTPAAA